MSESIEQIRKKAIDLANRMKDDAEFRAQIEQNPEETLIAAGLPANTVSDFLVEISDVSEVNGYFKTGCSVTCICTSTCIFTS